MKGDIRGGDVQPLGSPSPWRAWIERLITGEAADEETLSPSPWRAWIERIHHHPSQTVATVALPVEGVD